MKQGKVINEAGKALTSYRTHPSLHLSPLLPCTWAPQPITICAVRHGRLWEDVRSSPAVDQQQGDKVFLYNWTWS